MKKQRFCEPRVKLLLCNYMTLGSWAATNNAWPFWRIYHNDDEGAFAGYHDEETALRPGTIVAIPPNLPVDRRLERQVHHFYIHAQAAYPFHQVAPRILQVPAEPDILALIERLKPVVKDYGSGNAYNASHSLWIHTVVVTTLSHIEPETLMGNVRDSRVETVVSLLEDEFIRSISNTELASIANMSCNAFIRLFREQVGVPPQQYILEKRLDKAAGLLGHTRATMDEIAEECGFGNRNYFSRIFKKYRGASPAEFRKKALI